MILLLARASPKPMLRTIFSSLGAWLGLLKPNSFIKAGTTSLRYRSLSRAGFASNPSSMLGAYPTCFASSFLPLPPFLALAGAAASLPPLACLASLPSLASLPGGGALGGLSPSAMTSSHMPQRFWLVNRRFALLAEAPVLALELLDAHPGRLLALGADQGHRRHRDGSGALENASLGVGPLPPLLEVPLHQAQAFDFQAVGLPIDAHHFPALVGLVLLGALRAAGHLHRIADLELLHRELLLTILWARALPARAR